MHKQKIELHREWTPVASSSAAVFSDGRVAGIRLVAGTRWANKVESAFWVDQDGALKCTMVT